MDRKRFRSKAFTEAAQRSGDTTAIACDRTSDGQYLAALFHIAGEDGSYWLAGATANDEDPNSPIVWNTQDASGLDQLPNGENVRVPLGEQFGDLTHIIGDLTQLDGVTVLAPPLPAE